ncbi:MAG: manganese efflux pump MntP family protein [Deltaproteobacteria bacterium]
MSLHEILFIAVALAVDAFAVALATGVSLPKITFRHTFRLSWHFGLFQAMMNVLGWLAGLSFRTLIESVDHWIAFFLLAFVGLRMIAEAIWKEQGDGKTDPTRGRTLVMLAVATSIDSLAVGLSFSILKISVWLPALVIGITALLLTAVGLHLGRAVKNSAKLGVSVEIFGGLVLIGIGVKILFDHGVFG